MTRLALTIRAIGKASACASSSMRVSSHRSGPQKYRERALAADKMRRRYGRVLHLSERRAAGGVGIGVIIALPYPMNGA
ncbi:MAG: hypothetical protein V3T19_02730 [Acidiferrobacterales bacterium]